MGFGRSTWLWYLHGLSRGAALHLAPRKIDVIFKLNMKPKTLTLSREVNKNYVILLCYF
jgi:hypothetical protein